MAKREREYDLLTGPSTRRPVVDEFLLSIIDAHGEMSGRPASWRQAREHWLATAKKALFGKADGSGPKRIDDLGALYRMAIHHHRDRSIISMSKLGFSVPNAPKKLRSFRRLAAEAAIAEYGSSTDAIVDRLRRRFVKEKDYWLEIARSHDDVRETVEAGILTKILDLLSSAGVMPQRGPGPS